MFLLRGLLDRILLVAAIFAAACLPSFIAQYRQRLGGRLDQVLRDLAPFQEIANRNHGGDIRKLIAHHLQSTDRTFHDEGGAIQAMVDSAARLKASVEALNTDLLHQLGYLATNLDHDLARATWETFVPGFSFTPEYALFAVVVGAAIWLAFVLAWFGVARAISFRGRGPSRAPMAVRSSGGSTRSPGGPPHRTGT
jgi:hypothetical protein